MKKIKTSKDLINTKINDATDKTCTFILVVDNDNEMRRMEKLLKENSLIKNNNLNLFKIPENK